ncbi:MAG: dihydroneopterin aldolase [Verrucomicrobia bacterium]|nr:dihydroneopterin aldolase [Verrucomicrobiota bacterium]
MGCANTSANCNRGFVDKITIKDLELDAHIGVTAEERARPQKVLLTIVLERDLGEAGRTDTETTTTPYDEVVQVIKDVIADRPRKLIEAMALDVAREILFRRMAVTVTVEVKKFSIPRTKYVSVEIQRSM